MGFGNKFISKIQLLYTNSKAHLLLNGWIQPTLSPQRGIKQGVPLSALLFVIDIIPLSNLLDQNKKNLNLQLSPKVHYSHLLFADDVTLLADNINQINAKLELVQCYCRGSGARLNIAKSKLYPLHLQDHTNSPQLILPKIPVLNTDSSIKYLGKIYGAEITQHTRITTLHKQYVQVFWPGNIEHEPGKED